MEAPKTNIGYAQPRTTVQVTFPDKTILEGPIGTPLETFILLANKEKPLTRTPCVAAIVDGTLRELTMPVMRDVSVQLLDMASGDGSRIYRRTLAFLLTVAIEELYPTVQVVIDYALPSGAFFCSVRGRDALTEAELAGVKQHMLEIVAAKDPITRHEIALDEAIAMFRKRGDDDKVRLLKFRTKNYLTIYELRGAGGLFLWLHGAQHGLSHSCSIFCPKRAALCSNIPAARRPDDIPAYSSSPQFTDVFQPH